MSSRFIPKILLGRPWSLPCVSRMTCRLDTAHPILRRFPQAQPPVWGFHLRRGAAEQDLLCASMCLSICAHMMGLDPACVDSRPPQGI